MRAPVPRLHLHLRLDGARVAGVRFGGLPPPEAADALEGKGAAAAVNLVPLLFSAHPAAQSCAALTACEQALGLVPSRDQLAARRLMLATEILHEHLAQLTLEWPRRLHERVQPLNVGAWRTHLHALRDAVTPPEEWHRLHGASPIIDTAPLHHHLDSLEEQLARTLYAQTMEEWLKMEGYDALKRWALTTDTPLARTVDAIVDFGLQGLGAKDEITAPIQATRSETGALAREQTCSQQSVV